ncbi:MAG TPA: four helix bundle protein [Terracidiphilus sp.]|nr:four helix bundle protein [Terracidiphilus sp.]
MEGKQPAQSFRELIVWKKAIELAVLIYKATEDFPREEAYGLTSQMRRTAVSVPSNIAEGQGRLTTGEFKQFLGLQEVRILNCRHSWKLLASWDWAKVSS